MASSVNRREVISWMGVGALAPLLGACSALPGQRAGSANLDLLYVADTLDARQPGRAVVPATRLGPVSHLGRAPWMTGASASIAFPQLAPLLDAGRADEAAGVMKLTAADLLRLGVADQVIPEPEGGAHNDPKAVFAAVDRALTRHLGQLLREKDLSAHRYQKFRAMGAVLEETET